VFQQTLQEQLELVLQHTVLLRIDDEHIVLGLVDFWYVLHLSYIIGRQFVANAATATHSATTVVVLFAVALDAIVQDVVEIVEPMLADMVVAMPVGLVRLLQDGQEVLATEQICVGVDYQQETAGDNQDQQNFVHVHQFAPKLDHFDGFSSDGFKRKKYDGQSVLAQRSFLCNSPEIRLKLDVVMVVGVFLSIFLSFFSI
jgi:hypothetical protein